MPLLTPAQARVVAHGGGPLLVVGGPGTGKTTVLVERFAHLVSARATPPTGVESVLVLAGSAAAAAALRARLEGILQQPYEELAVHTVGDFCARLLRDEALEAGLDPFVVPLAAADRLAMLLEHVDELPLREHDLGASPAALLARIVARIDRLKEELVDAPRFAAWAQEADAPREREFAQLYEAHERLLGAEGALDAGDLVLRALRLLRDRPHVRARVGARHRHVLVDDLQGLSPAALFVVEEIARGTAGGAGDGNLVACAADDVAPFRGRDTVAAFRRSHPDAPMVRLERSFRCPPAILRAASAVVEPLAPAERGATARLVSAHGADAPGAVAFWRCANERAEAQSVAAHAEHLVRTGTPPEEIAVVVRSVRDQGRAIAVALEERALPYRLHGVDAFFGAPEVRDVLAWLRLLVDPSDAAAVVRALSRPPIELGSVDLARCIQIARRRKLDMVAALVAALESPQVPPEGRERILRFLQLVRAAAAGLDTTRPDLFVHRLIDRLALRRQQLFTAQSDVVERLVTLARFGEMAAGYVRRSPQATAREFARYAAAVADAGLRDEDPDGPQRGAGAVAVLSMAGAATLEVDHVILCGLESSRLPGVRRVTSDPVPRALAAGQDGEHDPKAAHLAAMRRLTHVAMTRARRTLTLSHAARSDRDAPWQPSPFAEEARAALAAEWTDRAEELFGPEETLDATFGALRDELLGDVRRTARGLSELRFDTDLDVTHAVARYLEIVKVAALMERPAGQSVADALQGINQQLLAAVSPLQREVLASSTLDELLLDAEREDRSRAAARATRAEPSLEAFLPRRGEGLALSASDIETYRSCPLRYKFARVLRIPQEPTIHQRFGILIHQVLERYHQNDGRSVDDLLELLRAGWRRGGFGDGEEERQLRVKAHDALRRYHDRVSTEGVDPVWFERSFTFRMGRHTVRGRVDRVDRLAEGGWELIDYKTGRPRTVADLREDVQLSLYAIGAREAWQLEAAEQAYLYVLDDEKVRVPTDEMDPAWITETVLEVADGIQGQGFEPTPSYATCSRCDFRIACPAAER